VTPLETDIAAAMGRVADVLCAVTLHRDQPPAPLPALVELLRLRSEGHAASCQCRRCPDLRRACYAAGLALEVQ
jgi:hypothetical protein